MKAKAFSSISLPFALLLIALQAYAANPPKSGAMCSKAGSTQTNKGIRYTCMKSGKKLVWNKGIPVKVVPTESPTPTPSPTQSIPAEPKNFSDIERNYDGVAYWAWKKSKEKIESSTRTFVDFENIIAPNSGILNKNPLVAFGATSRLFSDFAQPTKFYSISYSYDDLNWAQSKFEELFSDPVLLKEVQSPN
jgi:hypothetical protein